MDISTTYNGVRQQFPHYVAWLIAAGRSQGTIELRIYHVQRLMIALPNPLTARTEDLVAWLAGFDWAPTTRRSYHSSLRSFYTWAHRAGHIKEDPTLELPSARPPSGTPRPAPELALQDALLQADPRVRLMIQLQAFAGLRRGEVSRVHTNDIVQDMDDWSLHVRGKGNRERLVPLTRPLAAVLRAQETGWVFPSPGGGHLTPAHVGKLISRALGPGLVPHQLRHRFATRTYAVSGDLLVVQQLLGHSKPETTMIYTQVPAGAKRRIIDQAV